MKYIKVLTVLAVLALNGCKKETKDQVATPIPEGTSAGKIELGPVRGANVLIRSLQGDVLISLTTDEQGNFAIDNSELHSAVKDHDLILITTAGGVDIDPDDDGEMDPGQELPVLGSVSSIIPKEYLFTNKRYRANFLTSLVADAFSGVETIEVEDLNRFVAALGATDINSDGVVDMADFYYYSMLKNRSSFEAELRGFYLPYLHSGDSASRQKFVQDMMYSAKFVDVVSAANSGVHAVTLDQKLFSSDLYYAVNSEPDVDHSQVDFTLYSGEVISVASGNELVIHKCFNSTCGPNHVVHFTDETFLRSFVPDNDTNKLSAKYADSFEDVVSKLSAKKDQVQRLTEIRSEIEEIRILQGGI